jgi:sensor histidine kinase YesM
MVANLGALLRQALERGDDQPVLLATEVELTRCYLEIEQQRYGDQLRVRWDVAPEIGHALVPPLLLQPLAENAVRHGLAPRARRGELRIAAHRDGGTLRLVVEDDGVGPRPGSGRSGIGLASIRSRLLAAYGTRHEVATGPRPGGGYRVVVVVPWRSGEPRTAPQRSGTGAP